MATMQTIKVRLLALIKTESEKDGYSLHSINWYRERVAGGSTRLDIKNALDELTGEGKIRRKTHFDENNVRRVKITLQKGARDEDKQAIHIDKDKA